MKLFQELNEENIYFYAFKYYDNPCCVEMTEFEEDYARFKYVKKLINRFLDAEDFQPRLIMNHLIIIYNVFDINAAHKILKYKMNSLQLSVVKPFLKFLGYCGSSDFINIPINSQAEEEIRKL